MKIMFLVLAPKSFNFSLLSDCKRSIIKSDQVKKDEMGRECSTDGVEEGKPEGKRLVGRPRCRWVDSIKMDLREIGWDGVNWIDMAQDRDQWRALVNMVLNFQVP
jgi:hypothetical protein